MHALNELGPEYPDRAFKFTEREQAHRHAKDRELLKYFARGQWLGTLLALVTLGISGYAVHREQPWFATVALGALATIVARFVWRRGSKPHEGEDPTEDG
jgi:uncharacterized membrane protein